MREEEKFYANLNHLADNNSTEIKIGVGYVKYRFWKAILTSPVGKFILVLLLLGSFWFIGLGVNTYNRLQPKPDARTYTSLSHITVNFGKIQDKREYFEFSDGHKVQTKNEFSTMTVSTFGSSYDPKVVSNLGNSCGLPVDVPSSLPKIHAASEVQITYAQAIYSVAALRHVITSIKMGVATYHETNNSVCNVQDTMWDIQVPAPTFQIFVLNNATEDYAYSTLGAVCLQQCDETSLVSLRELSSNEFWVRTANLNDIHEDDQVRTAAKFYRESFEGRIIHATLKSLPWQTANFAVWAQNGNATEPGNVTYTVKEPE